jgi:hypothetical protein
LKYLESIADNLRKAGFSVGWVSAVDPEGRTIWIADAQNIIKNVTVTTLHHTPLERPKC